MKGIPFFQAELFAHPLLLEEESSELFLLWVASKAHTRAGSDVCLTFS